MPSIFGLLPNNYTWEFLPLTSQIFDFQYLVQIHSQLWIVKRVKIYLNLFYLLFFFKPFKKLNLN